MEEGTALLVYLGTFIASVVVVLSRRVMKPNARTLGSQTRNQWCVFLDITTEFMQLVRDKSDSPTALLKRIRQRTDGRSLPVNKSKVRVEKFKFKSTKLSAEWLIPKDEADPKRVILYCHGGGFCICTTNTHRQLVSRIATASRTRCLLFEYRRSPEFKYPCQIEDASSAYHYLMSPEGGGFKPENIIFGGDSAGGCLAMSLATHLKAEKKPLPRGIALISPWADLTNCSESWYKNAETDFLPPAHMMFEFARFYVPQDMKCDDPRISPAFADLSGLPPIFIQVSETEQLYDDSVRLYEKAKEGNVRVELDLYRDLPHVFQAFGGNQALQAIKKYGDWISAEFQKSPELSDELLIATKKDEASCDSVVVVV